MDPNANLEELLRIAESTLAAEMDSEKEQSSAELRMAELIVALDGWIRNGGFLPTRWPVREG